MKFILSLAFKNLFRYRRRTIITSIAIAAGLSIFIWVDAFMLGVEKDSERNMVWYETGSAQIMDKTHFADLEFATLTDPVENPDSIVSLLTAKNVKATKRISFSGELFFNDDSRQLRFFGIDLPTSDNVFRLKNIKMEQGSFLADGQKEILIGAALAHDLAIKTDDLVEIRTKTRYGSSQTLVLKVKGILNSANPVVNKGIGFIPLSVVNEALVMDGAVTEIPVYVDEWKNLEKELVKIRAMLPAELKNLEVRNWNDLSGNMIALESKKKFLYLLLFLVGVIAAVGISNTMLMAVYERIREIGMMRALGMRDQSIKLAFVIEAGGIGVIGSLSGIILGSIFVFYTVTWGFDFSSMMKDMDIGYRIYGVFKAAWHPSVFITSFVFGVLVSAWIALVPAGKALKMKITDCLHHQ